MNNKVVIKDWYGDEVSPLRIGDSSETNRGFSLLDFVDEYGQPCSIQMSSAAERECIWFGVGNKRMHLNRYEVLALIPLLQEFVETGNFKSSSVDMRYAELKDLSKIKNQLR